MGEPGERVDFMAALDRYEEAAISASAGTGRPWMIEALRLARRDVVARFDTVLARADGRVVS